jgi:signal transduction histidine kinase
MSLMPFVHFLTFVLLMSHAVYIFLKNPKALLNRITAAFISCFAIWSFAFIFVHNPYYTKKTAKIFLNISSFGWASYAPLFLWFTFVFTQKKELLKKKWLYPLFCGLPLLFIYKQWTDSIFSDLIEEPYGWKPVLDQSIGVLAGGIAHDFNNLLSQIVENIMQVKDDISPGENAYKFLLQSELASLKAAELAEKFITFSPGGWLMKEELLLGNLLKGLLDSEPGFHDTNVSYNIDISRDLAPIDGDKAQLNQVFQNLLLNALEAIEASPGGRQGQISIRADNIIINPKNQFQLKAGNYVKVSIEDNGIGIPPEIMEKLFDPYFSTKDRGTQKGMGLGLTLCYWIIKRHDGHIEVQSEPGKGTAVTLYLPAFTG